MSQPTLEQQLAQAERQAMDVMLLVRSLCDVVRQQAKEIEGMKAEGKGDAVDG